MPPADAPWPVDTTLLFFTESYPYDIAVEQTFIEPQLTYLRAAFKRVVLIPSQRGGGRLPVPDGVDVDEGMATLLGGSSRLAVLLRACISRLFWGDVILRPLLLRSPKAMKLLARTSGRAELSRGWLRRFLARQQLRPSQCVAYTFWCDHATAALALMKTIDPDLVVVSRVNGFDLFEDWHRPPYLPCRRFTLTHLDRLYAVSEYAMRYEVERYPWFASRCEVSRLGVPDPRFLVRGSAGDRFVLASCSGIIARKRVDLVLRGLCRAAQRRPTVRLEWHHFGDGDLAEVLYREAELTLPKNVQAVFHGHQPIEEIMRFYRNEGVDAFINASTAEGGVPVAIQEAASVGLPIIATAVGGIPEIVSDQNGVLVGANPSADEIADAVLSLIDRPDLAAAKSAESRRVWERGFQATENYSKFARRLVELRAAIP